MHRGSVGVSDVEVSVVGAVVSGFGGTGVDVVSFGVGGTVSFGASGSFVSPPPCGSPCAGEVVPGVV